MSEWKVYSTKGVEKAQVKELELHDEWMAECYLAVTVKSANPVSFQIGDYIDYRGERYSINYDPSVLKKARKGTYGEGFIYDSIKFVSDSQSKIVGCDFTDIVLDDNQMHYTGLPAFPFYCESVDDLLDRVQACLEELYPGRFILIGLNTARNAQRGLAVGRESDFVNAYKQYVDPTGAEKTDSYGKTSVALSVDNITCWEAITKINSDFGLNFIMRGDVVIAGINGVFTPDTFRYGKGNGLYEIERISEQDQQVITRLKAYGSEENLPTRYYAELNMQVFGNVAGIVDKTKDNWHQVSFWIDLDYSTKFFKERSTDNPTMQDSAVFLVRIQANGITANAFAYKNETRDYCYLCVRYMPDGADDLCETNMATADAFIDALNEGDRIDFVSGVEKSAFPADHTSFATENLPNNMSVSRLMLPGFPNKSLYDWVKEHGGTDCDDERGIATINGFTGYFSKDKHHPWLQSLKAENYGIRPGNIYFDGSNDTENIHPTLEGMKYGGHDVDVVAAAEQITDNGVYGEGNVPNFTITLPNLGFDLAEVFEEGATIDMKDGMCGSRSFKMANRPIKNSNGQWECKVERVIDDSLDLWFPYKDFQIKAGDHYVLTGIKLPDEYVSAASEKLFEAAIEALQKNDATRFTYQPRIDEIWMARQHDTAIKNGETSLHDTLHAGDIFLFKDDDLGIDEGIIIDVLTIRERGNDGIPTYEVTLRNEKQVNSIQRMIDKAVSSNASGGGAGGGGYTSRQLQSLIENYGNDYFLSKTGDDEAHGLIGFIKGFWVKAKGLFGFDGDGNIKANDINADGSATVGGDASVRGKFDVYGQATINDIKSRSYSGTGLADTGWAVTNDNGNGSSHAVFDYITIRKKMIVNALEIKETHFSAGDVAHTLADAEIARTDYLYVDGSGRETLLGYSQVKVPWLLRGAVLLLGKESFASRRLLTHYKKVRMTLTNDDLSVCNRVRCYFLAKDGDRETENWFRIGDLVRCQTWNVVKTRRETFIPDLEDHAGNVYWWRKITDVSWNTGVQRYVAKDASGQPTENTTTDINSAYVNEGGIPRIANNGTYGTPDIKHSPKTIDGNTYHWFDVAFGYDAERSGEANWCDRGSDLPAAGDKVVQFGNTTDPDRMNIFMIEVNGAGNPDAPDWKMYRGVYTFNLTNCWWGGESCRKTKWSVATGIEAYAPQFKWITEYGIARQVFVRDEVYWNKIAFERDDDWSKAISSYPDYSDDIVDANGHFVSRADGSPKNYVRKCRYYEQVSHNGSAWLCSVVESFYWRSADGRKIPAKTDGAEYVRNYTYDEPSAESNNWTEQVEKGDPGAFKSTVFCRSNSTPAAPSNDKKDGCNTFDNPVPPVVSGQPTWTDGIPDGTAILWASTAWFYSDGTHQNWTTPRQQTDTETLDIEFSSNSSQPSAPYNINLENRGNGTRYGTYGTNSRANGSGLPADWYDPVLDANNSNADWSNMKWRAERQISNGAYVGQWAVSRIKGENAVRIDLTNENDSILYNNKGTKLSGDVTSTARLWDGATEVSDNSRTSWSVSASGCTLSSASDSRYITVTGMSSSEGSVTVTATYTDANGTSYTRSSVLTLKKLVDVDKFDLDISPTALFLNTTDGWSSSKVLSVKVMRTPATGGTPTAVNPADYSLSLSKTVGTWGGSWPNSRTLTITQAQATSNESTTITLYESGNSSSVHDRETIPFNKAEDGAGGDTPMQAFQWNNSATTAPTLPSKGQYNNGWTATAPNRTSVNTHLWMTQAVKHTAANKSVTYDDWSAAVRISGDKGDPGADSKEREWIYIGASEYSSPYSGTHPKNITKDKDGTQRTYEYIHSTDDFVPYGWQDTAIATDDTNNKFVYASWRDKAKGATTWGDFTDPILWSNWGVQGIDGDGVQYIYKLFNHELTATERANNVPTNATMNSDGEWMPSSSDQSSVNYGWSDNPLSPTSFLPYCYCSVIKKLNGEWQKSGNYGVFETLGLWSKWTKDADVWTIDADGYWCKNGTRYVTPDGKYVKAEGDDGTGIELKGSVDVLFNSQAAQGQTSLEGLTGVSYGECYMVKANGHLYFYDGTTQEQGTPTGWADVGEIRGEKGDNSYVHIAYAHSIQMSNGTVTSVTGFTVDSDGSNYEWMGMCADNNSLDPGAPGRDAGSDLANARFYKWNYMKGKDGNGVEYIYLLTKEGFKPTIDESSGQGSQSDDEFYPSVGNYQDGKIYGNSHYWNDDPPADISETWPVLWWASRKKSNGVWQAFGSVDLHNRYAKDGTSPWIADLDNEMDSVACDNDGKPVAQQAVSTNVSLFCGSQKKAFITSVNGGDTGITISFGNKTAATAKDSDTVTITFATNAVISGKKEFEITLTAKDDASIQRVLTLTVNGLKGGATYNLVPSDSFVLLNKAKQYVPNVLTCTYNKFDVAKGQFVTPADGTIKYIKDGETAENAYKQLVPGTDFTNNVTFLLYVGATLVDRETIHIVKDGTDGLSVQSYIETQEAWSNQETTASADTMPSDCQEGDWKDSTPANTNSRTYLWRRSRKMTLKTDKSGYDAGQWSYTRLSGTNGTSIKTQGTVANTSKLLDRQVIPLVNGSDGQRTDVQDGWAYISEADRHLYQWSDELRSKSSTWVDWHSGWLDLGEFKGESGKTYYTHIAWAKGIILKKDGDGRAVTTDRTAGQRTMPNAVYPMTAEELELFDFSIAPQEDLTWMGTLVDEDTNDAADYKYYTWKYVQGADGKNAVRIDLDNQADLVSVDADGKVRFARTVVVRARIFDGASMVTDDSKVSHSMTKASMKIGSREPSSIVKSNGVVTVQWDFSKGDSVTEQTKTFTLNYGSQGYSEEFTLGTTKSDVIYQLMPSPSEVSFSKGSDGKTLTPSQINLYGGYVKENGGAPVTVQQPNGSQIDSSNYLYYRVKGADGTWGAWTAYPASPNNFLQVASSTTNTDIEFCISTAPDAGSVSDSNIVDRENVPIVKDGINGDKGNDGQSTFKSTVFTRTNETPLAPDATYGSYASPNPPESGSDMWPVKKSGGSVISETFWHDGIPAGEARLWASTRIFASDGQSPQQSSWTTPSPMTDTADFDVEFSSVANPNPPSGHPNTNTQWSNTSDATTIWMATSEKHNGVWSEWQVSKIKGEQGEPGGKATGKVQWFLALGGSTRPAVPAVTIVNNVPKSTIGGQTVSWNEGSDPSWSETKKYLYEIDYFTLSDGTGYWSDPFFLSEWAEQGPEGEAAWVFSANPANVIITQSLDNNLTSFSSATVSFAAKKGSESATITSIGTPSSSQFNMSKSGTTVVVSSPKTHGTPEEYYTEGSFKVVVNAQAADGSTSSQEVTVLCYANLLGTWKREVVAGVETVTAQLTQYLKDDDGNIITSKSLREDINDATQELSTLSNTVTTQGQTIQNQNTRLSTAEQNSAKLERDTTEVVENIANTAFEDIEGTQIALSDGEYIVQLKVDTEDLPTGNYVFDFAGFHYEGGEQFIEQRIIVENSGTYTITLHDEIQSGNGVATMLYIGRVFNVSSKITQTANNIMLQVSDKVNQSDFNIFSDSIQSSVKKISPSKNLLKGSLSAKGWSTSNAGAFTPNPGIKSAVLTSDGYISMADTDTNTWLSKSGISLSTGKSYTLSFLAKVTTAISYKLFFVYNSQPQVVKEGTVPSVSSATIRREVTIENIPLASTAFYLTLNCNAIKQPQLEEGETATAFVADTTEISSGIIQTADNIQLFVTQGLSNTGIDITNGTIKLQADKVTFCDANGGNTDKIWIDPTNGTLHAVNGHFSGEITATSGSITGQMNIASGGSIIVGKEDSYRIKIAQSSNRGYITMLDGDSNNIILINYDTGKNAGQIKVSEADAQHERNTFINPYSMESVYNYKNASGQWNGDYSHITTQVGRRMAETEYDDLYVSGGFGTRRHIKIGVGTTGSGSSEQSVVNLRAYNDNQESAWPRCLLDPNGANWMTKGHVHVMTMAELKVLLDNQDYTYSSHLANYAVMLTRIDGN